jgi:hypothetical protein
VLASYSNKERKVFSGMIISGPVKTDVKFMRYVMVIWKGSVEFGFVGVRSIPLCSADWRRQVGVDCFQMAPAPDSHNWS